jgi:dephospho-CoA kinase
MSNFIVGLTGGIGSGKSTVTAMFENLGITIIDADVIARDVVLPGSSALNEIKNYFGHQYINDLGQLNRSLLRTRIFSSPSDMLWLNNLLHPIIRNQLISQTKAALTPYCILVAPLLIENNLSPLVDSVLVIDVDENTQIKRTLLRDSSSVDEIKAIMASQSSRENRLTYADDIIKNNTENLTLLFNNVEALNNKYLDFVEKKGVIGDK